MKKEKKFLPHLNKIPWIHIKFKYRAKNKKLQTKAMLKWQSEYIQVYQTYIICDTYALECNTSLHFQIKFLLFNCKMMRVDCWLNNNTIYTIIIQFIKCTLKAILQKHTQHKHHDAMKKLALKVLRELPIVKSVDEIFLKM